MSGSRTVYRIESPSHHRVVNKKGSKSMVVEVNAPPQATPCRIQSPFPFFPFLFPLSVLKTV